MKVALKIEDIKPEFKLALNVQKPTNYCETMQREKKKYEINLLFYRLAVTLKIGDSYTVILMDLLLK